MAEIEALSSSSSMAARKSDEVDSELDVHIDGSGMVHEEVVTLELEDELALRLDVLNKNINQKKTDVDAVKVYVERCPELVGMADSRGMYPIHIAARRGHEGVVACLLEYGADVNTVDDERHFSSLQWACRKGRLTVARMLIERGADVNYVDANDGTCAIHWAAYSGRIDILELLLQHGADVVHRDGYGFTPLHWACRRGRKEATHFLIDRGADIEEQTLDGSTPLHCVCFEGHQELALSLIDKGADRDHTNLVGFSPLQLWHHRGGHWCASVAENGEIATKVLSLHPLAFD